MPVEEKNDDGRSAASKPSIAVVSTFDELCGIAGYTRSLVKQLEPHFSVEVFDLEQFFMRSTNAGVRKKADAIIEGFCRRLKTFDSVNIQLEHGTLGVKRGDIIKRFNMIADAARALSVTFHTILPQRPFPWAAVSASVMKRSWGEAGKMTGRHFGHRALNAAIYGKLRTLQGKKKVSVIVHTPRDSRLMKHVNGFNAVFDHPLAFLSAGDVASMRRSASRADFPSLRRLDSGVRLVGVFGFINTYKGIDTAMRALRNLPGDYHLAIFGGLHPNEIPVGRPINPYVGSLVGEILASGGGMPGASKPTGVLTADDPKVSWVNPAVEPKFRDRVHFMGALGDDDFARAMAVCDFVVLPYLEVGQSASGPMSMAVEMGAKVFASRTFAFLQFEKYFPGAVEFFDIGNYLELAERILAASDGPSIVKVDKSFDTATNADVYVRASAP